MLITKKLQADENAINAAKLAQNATNRSALKEVNSSQHEANRINKKQRTKTLKCVFDEQDLKLAGSLNEKKTAAYQLKLLGHAILNKTSMLYSRNLGMFLLLDLLNEESSFSSE